jgi:hypothetical protein
MGYIKQQMLAELPGNDEIFVKPVEDMTQLELLVEWVEDWAGKQLETHALEMFTYWATRYAREYANNSRMKVSGYRVSDPKTSKEAYEKQSISRTSQQWACLAVYGSYMPKGATDDEVGVMSGLAEKGAGYWKRCSELRRMGFIVDTGLTRTNPVSGAKQMVCRITDKGREALEND